MSMDPRLLAVPIAFIILAAIACWYAISAKGRWWHKLLLIVTVPAFGIVSWYAMTSYLGWPTSQSLSGQKQLLWAEIREPDPKTNDTGAIYLWLVPMEEEQIGSPGIMVYRPSNQEPRAYWLKYSRKAHERLFRAKQKLKKGKTVILEWKEGDGKGSRGSLLDGLDNGAEGGQNRGPNYDGNDQDFHEYNFPAPQFPPKENDE